MLWGLRDAQLPEGGLHTWPVLTRAQEHTAVGRERRTRPWAPAGPQGVVPSWCLQPLGRTPPPSAVVKAPPQRGSPDRLPSQLLCSWGPARAEAWPENVVLGNLHRSPAAAPNPERLYLLATKEASKYSPRPVAAHTGSHCRGLLPGLLVMAPGDSPTSVQQGGAHR